MKNLVPYFLLLLVVSSCAVGRNYTPSKKYPAEELQEDFRIFRAVLEESHPSLYWYTPRDSMDFYFESAQKRLTDSLHEYQFRNILSYVLAQVRCGHTAVQPSRAAMRYSSRTRGFAFPLSIKAWGDTVVITSNINRKDSVVTRGALLKAIEGRSMQQILDSMFRHISSDGYNLTHKYQALSNGGTFRNYYGNIYGLRHRMKVEIVDTAGVVKSTTLNVYNPAADTPAVDVRPPKVSRKDRRSAQLRAARDLRIDTAASIAVMDVNTFAKKRKLRSFFRRSFSDIREQKINHLVVDLRGNGGGSVTLSNLLTKYIADAPFKIADSLYAVTNKSSFGRLQNDYFWNRLFFIFMTGKKGDDRYHFALYENKYFRPRKKNHFDGTAYILTGGNTFSAASLVTKALKNQDNVIVVGEETGGGAYGNSAWLIPEVTLPNTRVRFRLPLFRLVIDSTETKGRGVMPEVAALPTVEAIRKNRDFKTEKVMELVRNNHSLCGNGVITWMGDPEADGLGWMLQLDGKGMFKAGNLAKEFMHDGLRVEVCLLKTNEKFDCECAQPLDIYNIRSIRRL